MSEGRHSGLLVMARARPTMADNELSCWQQKHLRVDLIVGLLATSDMWDHDMQHDIGLSLQFQH